MMNTKTPVYLRDLIPECQEQWLHKDNLLRLADNEGKNIIVGYYEKYAEVE